MWALVGMHYLRYYTRDFIFFFQIFTMIGPRGQWCWSQLMVEDGFNPCSAVGSWEGRLLRAGLTKGYPPAGAWWWAGAKGACGLKQTSHSWAGQPASKEEARRWRQEMAIQSVPWEKENRRWADYIWPKEKKKKGFLKFFLAWALGLVSLLR